MRKRWMLPFCLLAVVSCEKPKAPPATATAAKVERKTEVRESGAEAIASTDDEPEAPNERTKASPRPEKTYPKPSEPSYPVATVVEGKEGMVVSPYNGKIVDVRGLTSGMLVADPQMPADQKAYFRVP